METEEGQEQIQEKEEDRKGEVIQRIGDIRLVFRRELVRRHWQNRLKRRTYIDLEVYFLGAYVHNIFMCVSL